VRYIVVQQRCSVYYFDRVDILHNFVDIVPLFSKIQCTYNGTYLLFVHSNDSTRDDPSGPANFLPTQQSPTSTNTSSILRPVDRNSSRRPSTTLPPTTDSTTTVNGSSRANVHSTAPAVDYNSDDSQVKKRIKVAYMDWQGQTFYITAKESVITILRDTYSVRTHMEDGQLQLLVNHVGDFAYNYTAENFKTGLIKRHSKSALLSDTSFASIVSAYYQWLMLLVRL